MKHVVLGAVAGLASVAGAQTVTLSIVPSHSTLDTTVTTVFTLSIYATADFGTHIAGGEFAISTTDPAGMVSDMTGEAASWAALGENDRGYDGNGGHNGLVFGQLIFPPFIPPSIDSALPGPVLLGVMTVTVNPNTSGLILLSTANGLGFIMEIFDAADDSFTQVTDVVHGSILVGNIPAPSSIALLGLGGLVAGRRRRRR